MNKDKIMSGDPWAMLIDPIPPRYALHQQRLRQRSHHLQVDQRRRRLDRSLAAFPRGKTSSFVQAIAMDPANPQHLALTFHSTCQAPYNGLCLSRSNDGGTTWQIFNGPTQLTGWQEAATISVLGPASYLYASTGGGWYTGDEGKTWSNVVKEGFYASYAGSTDLAPDGTMYLAGANSLYKSTSKSDRIDLDEDRWLTENNGRSLTTG